MEAVTNSWQQLFFARLVLGLAIGPISATAPVYTSECAPAAIRGALTMQWQVSSGSLSLEALRGDPRRICTDSVVQMWTAFGILAGQLVCLLLNTFPPHISWRFMLGSTFFVPIVVCALIVSAPESPRWCMLHGRPRDAYKSMLRLRRVPLQAARDLYLMHRSLVVDEKSKSHGASDVSDSGHGGHGGGADGVGGGHASDLWKVPRVRRAALASGILMFMQQFCGVNVIAYYSSQVFVEGGFSRSTALWATMGTGVLSWLFAIVCCAHSQRVLSWLILVPP